MKLDSTGNLAWQKSLGGTGEDTPHFIQQLTDGGFIVVGESDSYDGDLSMNWGYEDGWIVKLDSTGNIIWQKSFGGGDTDYAYCAKQTTDGGFAVAAETDSYDGDVSGMHGAADCWIIKFDSGGNIVWQKCIGGLSLDVGNFIFQTFDGGFCVAGASQSDSIDVSENNGGYDFWLMELDSLANIIWQENYGGSYDDVPWNIQQGSDGKLIATGNTRSNDADVSGNHGNNDIWVIQLDSSGNLLWQKCLGGTNSDYSFSECIQTADSGFVLAGYTESNDQDVFGNHGGIDYWIIKLSINVVTSASAQTNNIISIYPNPVQSQLIINLPTSSNEVMIVVYDVQGRMISLPVSFQFDKALLNTADLPEGFYTLQITDKKTAKIEVGKFVKQE